MLFLERESEPVDDGAEDFQEFGNTVVTLRLVNEPIENVVDLKL